MIREILRLAIPLALVQVGASFLGVIDTAVVGRTSASELAAVGLGNSLLFSLSILGMGLVLGTEPIIAQAIGARDPRRARRAFRQGIWCALIATPILLALLAGILILLPYAGVDPDVIPHVRRYVGARALGVLPFLLYWAVKAWLQAHGKTRAPVIGVVVAILVELPLVIVLVFGVDAIGLPALGVLGAGIAHSCTNVVRLLIVTKAAEDALHDESIAGEPPPANMRERIARMRTSFRKDELFQIMKIGLPLGLTMSLEVSVFAFAALTMGRIGENELAAHQVAIQCASTTFNVMVGLGSATSVVVGRRIGAGDQQGAYRAGMTALAMSIVFMLFTAALFLFEGEFLARLLTDKAHVVVAAGALLAVAAAFQIVDGMQAVAAGALRGAGDTRATFVITLVAYWAVAMPCVLLFVGPLGLGAPGVWWGLTVGLAFAAVFLVGRFVIKARQGYARL